LKNDYAFIPKTIVPGAHLFFASNKIKGKDAAGRKSIPQNGKEEGAL